MMSLFDDLNELKICCHAHVLSQLSADQGGLSPVLMNDAFSIANASMAATSLVELSSIPRAAKIILRIASEVGLTADDLRALIGCIEDLDRRLAIVGWSGLAPTMEDRNEYANYRNMALQHNIATLDRLQDLWSKSIESMSK